MRVSSFEQFDMMKFNLSQVQLRQNQLQNQAASGKAFSSLSESPIRANQSLIVKNSLNQVEQYTKNVNDANSYLSAVESNLGSVEQVLMQARDQGLKAANGTFNQENLSTFASILNQNIEQIISVSNAKFLGKQLFSGEKTQTVPFTFDGTTATYHGDTNSPTIRVSPNAEIEVSKNGEDTFRDVLQAMVQLRDDVQSGNVTNIETAIAGLDVAMGKFTDLRAEIGVRMESMDMYKSNYEAETVNLKIKRGEAEDADLAQTIIDYSYTKTIQQAILSTTQKMMSISLLNYM